MLEGLCFCQNQPLPSQMSNGTPLRAHSMKLRTISLTRMHQVIINISKLGDYYDTALHRSLTLDKVCDKSLTTQFRLLF